MTPNDDHVGYRDIQELPNVFTSSLDPKVILSNLAERTSQILDATRCSVVRVDRLRHPGRAFVFTAADDPTIEGYSLNLEDYPEIQIALEENHPILVRDEPDDPVAARIRARHRKLPFPISVALPLSYRAESFGVLFLRFSDPNHSISKQAIAFCQLIAFGAAVALHNAREYEELLAEVKKREHEAQQIEDLNRLRMEIFSSASHDLRIPLNSIVGYVDLLCEQAYGELDPEQHEVLGYVADNAQALLQIVNTLVDHARLEEGKIPVNVSRGEIPRLLEELRITFEPLTLRRDVRLDFQSIGRIPPVETDWVKLKRVLLNLLHNSLKFTDHGSISVIASAIDDRVRFEVADTGSGIAPENLPNIFNQFYRANPTRADGPGGLGLTIVKRYCEMLGGEISVVSELGKGSQFTLMLPVLFSQVAPSR